MGNPNCCFMIIAVTFFFSSQSPRGTVYTYLIDSYIPNIHVFINEKLCPSLPLGKRLFNVKQVSCRLWCQETTQVGHGVAHSKNGSGLCRSKIQGPVIYVSYNYCGYIVVILYKQWAYLT